MTTSTELKQITQALVSFHKEVGKIAKDATNPFFKSRFASLPGILDSIKDPLIKNGLAIVQFPEGENGLTTKLLHTSGEWMEATYQMKSVKDTPQDRGSALTYQRRYAVGAILSLSIDDDDDGNIASQVNGHSEHTTDIKDDKPWLNENTDVYKSAVEKLKKGQTTIAKIEAAYKLSKVIKDKLKSFIPINVN